MKDEFSRRLSDVRKLRGFTQKTFAPRVGLSQQQYSGYERGIAPKPEMIAKICELLEVSADYLVGLTSDPIPLSADERELLMEFRSRGAQHKAKILEARLKKLLNKPNSSDSSK